MTQIVQGATFAKKSFTRPTTMSLALEKVGLIAVEQMQDIREMAAVAHVRNRNDNLNQRPSLRVVL